MSIQIPFNKPEQHLNDQSIIKPKPIKNEFGELKFRSLPRGESNLNEAQGSASEEMKGNHLHSLNRKVDYQIEQDSNELVIRIRDKETGEIVRQIPEEEFLRLTNRISDFNKSILDQTA